MEGVFADARTRGVSLLETMFAVLVVGVAAGAIGGSMLQLNDFAARQRNQSNARNLCQECIEKALTSPYSPDTGIVSADLGGSWPINTAPKSEQVTVYLGKDSSTVSVPATRTTTLAMADASLKLLRVTVQVAYTFRGRNYTYQMGTLRAPE
jgi:type II secretory pathway pseudopilin PulG